MHMCKDIKEKHLPVSLLTCLVHQRIKNISGETAKYYFWVTSAWGAQVTKRAVE